MVRTEPLLLQTLKTIAKIKQNTFKAIKTISKENMEYEYLNMHMFNIKFTVKPAVDKINPIINNISNAFAFTLPQQGIWVGAWI